MLKWDGVGSGLDEVKSTFTVLLRKSGMYAIWDPDGMGMGRVK